MYAVIKTGGKQYKVSEGDVLNFEKIEGDKGDTVSFDEVLLVSKDEDVRVGTPFVENTKVIGEIISQIRGPKIIVFKMKRRKDTARKRTSAGSDKS